MRYILFFAPLGTILGILAAHSIEPANACSCMQYNGEIKTLSVTSITQTAGETDMLAQENARWGQEIIATTYYSDRITIEVNTDNSEININTTLSGGE